MASTPKEIQGPIVATVRVEAQPGKGDELARWFANLKAHAESKEEPGTFNYHVVRSGDSFAVWEEYASIEAIVAHTEGNLFKEFLKVQGDLMKPAEPAFWSAKSLPEATVKF